MPEGPTIIILKEAVTQFEGKEILEAAGSAKIDMDLLPGKKVTFKSWGKHFLICCDDITVRVHFLLFGSYTINERKKQLPKLSLQFENGEFNMYSAAINILADTPDNIYDWTADVMNEKWSPTKATHKLKAQPNMLVCEALLDQQIFSGVGNIIKNEVLFKIKVHPKSTIGQLPEKQLHALVKEAHNYSYDFLRWKKVNELKQHWLAYNKKICPRCDIPLVKKELGKTKRSSYYCENCQVLYQLY